MRYQFFILIFLCAQICIGQDTNDFIIKAAERGDTKAQQYLVMYYLEGRNGFKKNVEEAYRWAQVLAENGDSIAQYMLATDEILKPYVENKGRGQIFWLEQAANSSHPKALEEYGRYLVNSTQYIKALPYLRKAAMEASSLYSIYLIAEIYYNGLGVKKDVDEAMENYKLVTYLSEKIENINPSIFPGEFVIEAYKHVALSLINKDNKLALENINKAIKKTQRKEADIAYIDLLDIRATIYLYMDETDKCKKEWDNIVNLMPDYAHHNNTFLTNVMTGNVDYLIPQSNSFANNTIAIVIANENYKRVPNVPHAINDGAIFKKYLLSTFGIPEENIEYLEDASLNDIKYAFANISQKCEAFKNQYSVIVYYAGHGVPDDKSSEAYLLPIDGFGTDPSSGLKLDDVYGTLATMPAKSVIVLLDACFSGTKRDGGMLMASRGITIKPKMQVPEGKLIVISATSDDQTAFPIEEQKHGLFTYTLLRKIQETGGDITLGELVDYVTETVKSRSIDLTGKLQSPTVSVSSSIKDVWRNFKIK